MTIRSARWFAVLTFAICAGPALSLAQSVGQIQTSISAEEFAAEMDRAMTRMHEGMAAHKPTGNFDRDFALMMIPHHQGAIDMAEIQLRFGRDERLRRLAQGIIIEQKQEIAVMQRILDATSGAAAAPSQLAPSHTHHKGH